MANKIRHHEATLPVFSEQPTQKGFTETELSQRQRDTQMVEARFMEAIAEGSLDGDVLLYDENGELIRTPKPRTTIFDL